MTQTDDTVAERPAPVQVLEDRFISAMAGAATGVSVVTTDGIGGRAALTVSAMCSVSAEPPMVLVCVNGRSSANDTITANGVFCVNVLGTRHDHIAETFAGRLHPRADRWDLTAESWDHAASGAPRVADAIASFDCAVHHVVAAGSHRVFIGRVTAVESRGGDPLVYASRAYCRTTPFEPSQLAVSSKTQS